MKRTIRLLLTGLTMIIVLVGLAISPSYAAPKQWIFGAGLGNQQLFVGQQKNAAGLLTYCTDYELLAPAYAGNYRPVQPGGFVRNDGTALSPTENHALSYLLYRWGATSDNPTAAAVQLAVWALSSAGRSWDTPGMAEILRKAQLPNSVIALGRSLTEQSLKFAGPYRITIDLTQKAAATVNVLGGKGLPVPGLAIKMKAAGALRFSEPQPGTTLGTESNWTSAETAKTIPVQRTGLGDGSVSAFFEAPLGDTLQWLAPSSPKAQRLLVAGSKITAEGSAKISAAAAFQPQVITKTSATRLDGPGTLLDEIQVSGKDGQEWLVDPLSGTKLQLIVQSTLWGPFPTRPVESDVVPTGAPQVGTVATPVGAAGSYRTKPITVSKQGFYVWTERIEPITVTPAKLKDFVKPWQSRFGVAAETSVLAWTPEISTKLSAHEMPPGSSITDAITVRNLPISGIGDQRVDLVMYGPMSSKPARSDDVPTGSPVFRQLSATLTGSGSAQSATVDFGPLNQPGCYTVVATMTAAELTNSSRSAFGEPSETVCVETPPTPVIAQAVPAAAPNSAAELAVTGPQDQQIILVWAVALVGLGAICGILTWRRRNNA